MVLLRSKSSIKKELDEKYKNLNDWVSDLNNCPTDLRVIFSRHKQLWFCGVQCPAIGPDEYGMFRTKDIQDMSMNEVYLGGVFGLFTHTAAEWESFKEEHYDKCRAEGKPLELPEEYRIVADQYLGHLKRNLKMMRAQIYDNGYGRECLAENIGYAVDKIANYGTGNMVNMSSKTAGKITITSPSLSDDGIIDCSVRYAGNSNNSTFLNLAGRFLLPEGFQNGVNLTTTNYKNHRYYDLADVLSGNDKIIQPKEWNELKNNDHKAKHIAIGLDRVSRKDMKDNLKNVRKAEKQGMRFGM